MKNATTTREIFLYLKNGSILPLGTKPPTAKQLETAKAWCEEGGQWIYVGETEPRPVVPMQWKCLHPVCRVRNPSRQCPWMIDDLLFVCCQSRGFPHQKTALYQGGPADPPLVSTDRRDIAIRPVTLASGLVLEVTP